MPRYLLIYYKISYANTFKSEMNSQNNRMTTQHIKPLRKPKKPKMLVSISSNSERTLINNKH